MNQLHFIKTVYNNARRPFSIPLLRPSFCWRNSIVRRNFNENKSNNESEFKSPAVVKVRLYKRIFSYGMFTITILGCWYLKKQRQLEWSLALSQATRLGDKFGELVLFDCNGYVIAEPVLRALKKIQRFNFYPDDVLLVSFPKTGKLQDPTQFVAAVAICSSMFLNNLSFSAFLPSPTRKALPGYKR